MSKSKLYDTDFAKWAEEQAKLLRRLAVYGPLYPPDFPADEEIDWENIAEEIESFARTDKREILSHLAIICEQLLKWDFQPDARSNRWRSSIRGGRNKIAEIIEESPSLKDYAVQELARAYERGRRAAAAETRIANLPETCPWTFDQVLDHAFWPKGDTG